MMKVVSAQEWENAWQAMLVKEKEARQLQRLTRAPRPAGTG